MKVKTLSIAVAAALYSASAAHAVGVENNQVKHQLKAPNITECIPRNSNQIQTMNEQCSQFYGLGHSLNKIEQRDCPSGYDRGICKFKLL